MSSSPSWSPDESHDLVFAEKMWFQGNVLMGVAYGMVVVLSAMCMHSLWLRRRAWSMTSSKSMFFLCYVSFIFLMGSISFAGNNQFVQMAFIDNRNYPGGPSGYIVDEFSVPINIASDVALVMANWCADLLLIWRCTVIFRDCRNVLRLSATVIPSLMFAASFAMGTMWLVQTSSPSTSFIKVQKGINYTAPYFGISLAINIVVTSLIVVRLLLIRHRLTSVLGGNHGSHYTSIAALIVESASLYTASSLLFLIPFALKSPVANLFIQIMGEIQIIAPLLIIYRVLEGKAWSEHTDARTTALTGGGGNSIHLRRLPSGRMVPCDLVDQNQKAMEVQVTVDVTKNAV
ncbi:hypothetical protein BJ138DRAFT_1011730 [Hygrophoropsis aurantiaca]|uniref:Uncharacterized protein n=1 Tax=Hygrophoropsis aurantiaca TaxID=72124 RepID=A0ACB8A8H1_9AGAM|nr:hypothetical protein BJ138DRAFT_1011730 [Hygrophoropsis aurantiaca]